MKKLQFRIKCVYGNELSYPACETLIKYCQLQSIKTLRPTDMAILELLGFELERVF